MFLNQLNLEESKAFFEIARNFMLVNKRLLKKKKVALVGILNQINLKEEDTKEISLESALHTIKNSNERVKNIVYFNIMRAGLIDEEYRKEEIAFLENLEVELNIFKSKKIEFANYFYKFSKYEYKDTLDAEEEAKKII